MEITNLNRKKSREIIEVLISVFLLVSLLYPFSNPITAYADMNSWEFNNSGNVEIWTAPSDGDYEFEVYGAQGNGNGGKGGKTQATFTLNQGDKLFIRVGGQNGFNGGGAGQYSGGGASDVRLNTDNITNRLLVGAGGGGKSGGTDGGSGTGQGGNTVGSGAGSNGTNGGGGGASYNYTYETGYWQSTGYYRDTGYYRETGYWKQQVAYCYSQSSGTMHNGIHNTATGCQNASNAVYESVWVNTGSVWVSTGQVWVDTGSYWQSTGYATITGNSGKGGSNFIANSGTDKVSTNGARTGNGYIKITQLNQAPEVKVETPVNNIEVTSGTIIQLTGTIKDMDTTGTMTVKYSIDNGTPVVVNEFTASPNETEFYKSVLISNNLAFEHTLNVWGEDSEGGISVKIPIRLQIKDKTDPTLTLSKSDAEWTNKGVTITATASDNHEVERIKLPNGNYVNGSNASFVAKENGTYTFVAEDSSGNTISESITISNIETGIPNAPTVNLNENWTSKDVTVSMNHNGDNGDSGIDRVEYKLEGATSKDWTSYQSLLTISAEGITTVKVRVVDKANNESRIITKEIKIDRTNPILTVTPDVYGLTNMDVILTVKATDNLSGIKRIKLPNGNYINASETTFQVGENATYIFEAEDNAGNKTEFETVVRNIKKNVLITNKQEVLLELQAEDFYSGVTHMQFKNESGSWSLWESYNTSKDWMLSPIDGLKHVSVQYKDKVGNISPTIEDIIILDTTKPTVSNFVINDNAPYTKSTSVTLKLKGIDYLSGIKDLFISNDNVNWTKMNYPEEIPWILNNGDGTKTVYLKVSDVAGNISSVVTDKIFLDTTKPLANISINNGDSYSATRDVRLTLTYSDIAGSGIETVKVIEGDREYTLPAPTPNSPVTIPWTLDFGVVKTVSIVAVDKAGNVSNITSDSIIVDKLTIKDFTLEDVVNPLEFNSKHPFTPKVWSFAPQPMISGGNIAFTVDVKTAVDAEVVQDKVDYKVEIVGDYEYHKAFVGTMRKAGNHYTQTITIPKDAPNGAKVYVLATAQRKLLVSPYDIQTVYFPGGEDLSQKAQIGIVEGNIYDVIRFNEIQ